MWRNYDDWKTTEPDPYLDSEEGWPYADEVEDSYPWDEDYIWDDEDEE